MVPVDAGLGRIPAVRETLTRWGQWDVGVETPITVAHSGTLGHTNSHRKDSLALVELTPWLAQGLAKLHPGVRPHQARAPLPLKHY